MRKQGGFIAAQGLAHEERKKKKKKKHRNAVAAGVFSLDGSSPRVSTQTPSGAPERRSCALELQQGPVWTLTCLLHLRRPSAPRACFAGHVVSASFFDASGDATMLRRVRTTKYKYMYRLCLRIRAPLQARGSMTLPCPTTSAGY